MSRPVSEAGAALRPARQRGVTLVELMVALVIGLVVVLAGSTAFLSARRLFEADADIQQAQDTMRYARYVVQNLVRQAGYVDYAPDRTVDGGDAVAGNARLPEDPGPGIAGATNTSVSGTGDGVGLHGADPAGANDSLAVRFFGRAAFDGREAPDETMIDCLGQAAADASAAVRASNVLYVARAGDGEPELYCKRRVAAHADGVERFQSQPIARGVEKFKVVFGHDADGDGVPERWIDAQALDELARSAGVAATVGWHRVVAVRVGMVVRSARPNGDLRKAAGQVHAVLTPLGPAFAPAVSFTPPDDGRFRLNTTFTLMLRNVMQEPP